MREYTELESLQSEFSDFHKAYYGFRPRYSTDAEWNSVEYLRGEIQAISDAIDARKATFEGREQLRCEGWYVEESDPEFAALAAQYAAEREAAYAAREAEYFASFEKPAAKKPAKPAVPTTLYMSAVQEEELRGYRVRVLNWLESLPN